MKTVLVLVLLLGGVQAKAEQWVRGYYRPGGQVVNPYTRSSPPYNPQSYGR